MTSNDGFILRPFNFTDEDYRALVEIRAACYSDNQMRAADYKRIDGYSPTEKYDWVRTMAEVDGRPVGYGMYVRALWYSTPNLYTIGWATHPDYRNRGIASAYWDHLQRDVFPPRDISALIANARSDIPAGEQFLLKRGFREISRETYTELDLSLYDPTPFEWASAKIAERGIELIPLSTLIANDPTHMEQIVRLANVLRDDEPNPEDQAHITAEEFRNYYMSSDTYYPEGWFIAVDHGRYVGWCAVLPNRSDPENANNGITVIDREYRRIGLATAMKLKMIEHARDVMQAKRITTSNLAVNPMLQINLKLGYQSIRDEMEYKRAV